MPPLPTLDPACTPRDSVFDPAVRDTVYSIDELRALDPAAFFRENWVTEGMRILLAEAFKRLEGKTAGASGVFHLSQSMGGGKTHTLLALGLLALHPAHRQSVMQGFYSPGPLGAIPVVTFSGRKTHTPFGIWGEIAQQLNKKDAFRDFYAPLSPPGEDDWVELLRGGPGLILIDELPLCRASCASSARRNCAPGCATCSSRRRATCTAASSRCPPSMRCNWLRMR